MWNVVAVGVEDWLPFVPSLDANLEDGWSWKRVLNGVGTGEFTIRTKAPGAELDAETVAKLGRDGWRTLIVVEWIEGDQRTAMYAGFVTSLPDYDPVSGVLRLRTQDARAILRKRGIMPVDLNYQGESFGAQVGNIKDAVILFVRGALIGGVNGDRSLDWRGRAGWALPVTIIDDAWVVDDGEDYRVDVRGRSAEDIIADLQDREDAPDIDFQPVWDGDSLAWQVIVDLDPHRWDVLLSYDPHPTAQAEMTGFRMQAEYQHQVTALTAIGGGSGKSMIQIPVTHDTIRATPHQGLDLEESVSGKQDDRREDVRSMGIAELRKLRRGIRQYSFGVHTSERHPPTQFVPGAHVLHDYPGDPFTLAQRMEHLILSVEGGPGPELGLEVAQVG